MPRAAFFCKFTNADNYDLDDYFLSDPSHDVSPFGRLLQHFFFWLRRVSIEHFFLIPFLAIYVSELFRESGVVWERNIRCRESNLDSNLCECLTKFSYHHDSFSFHSERLSPRLG